MAATPLLLVDNLLDTVVLYPGATLSASSELAGREAFRLADYRRERTWWQTATTATNHNVSVDAGAGNTRNADALWIDRGHNLAGKTIKVDHSDNGLSWTTLRTLTVPATSTVGGDPTTTTFAATEEGALYALFAAAGAAHRYWRVLVVENWQPIVPGAILGQRVQLVGYSRTYDEDQGERTEVYEMSRAGYRGTDRTYHWRRAVLDLGTIGAADYDAQVRVLRRQLFELNQPCVLVMQYDTKPERGWLYQYDGTAWGFAKERTLRAGQIPLRECGHLVG